MKVKYQNQRILITGASAGIGKAMAKILAGHGVKSLILVARREHELENLKRELIEAHPQVAVHIYPCDLTDKTAIDHLLHFVSREVGAIDILINNAGMGDYGLFESASWHKTEKMIQLNIQALTYLTYKFSAPMIALGRGGILNISSGVGLMFMPGMSVYAATKHYVTAFTEALRLELKGTGVVVSQVCPGPVHSEFSEVAGSQDLSKDIPAWVVLSAEQCAEEALAGFAKGQALIVPGTFIRAALRIGSLIPRPLLRMALGGQRKQMLKAAQKESISELSELASAH